MEHNATRGPAAAFRTLAATPDVSKADDGVVILVTYGPQAPASMSPSGKAPR